MATSDSSPAHIDEATLSAAETLAAIQYTPEERQQLAVGLEVALARFSMLRDVAIDNAVCPATVFDPRLPGFELPESARPTAAANNSATADLHIPPATTPFPGLERASEIAFASIIELATWLRDGAITSCQLTTLYLERLRAFGPVLECVVTLTPERALDQAARADAERAAGVDRGLLHGIPWVAKDLLDTAGIATTWGAEPYAGRVPSVDATVVRRLADAGAVLVAKVSLGALAYGDIWHGGETRNPWNLAEGSSGSSAGSASAVAAGLAAFGIGSETMGSIVNPAMRCGVAGLRPTFGRVPRTGAMALAWSLDKVGPLTRRVEDTAVVLAAINGHDGEDTGAIDTGFAYYRTPDIRGMRVGFDPAWFEVEGHNERANELDRSVLAALESAGAEIVPVEFPPLPYDALWTVLQAETAAAFDALTRSDEIRTLRRQDPEAWPTLFRRARFLPAVEYLQASRFRRIVMGVVSEIFDQVDVLVGPTFTPPLQLVTNMTGHPALTVRTGFVDLPTRARLVPLGSPPQPQGSDTHRVPHGITVWGNLFDESQLLRVGHAIETAAACWGEAPVQFR